MKSLYLILHLFTISFPLIRSFEPKIQYARKWKALLPGLIITATFFIIWDTIFTAKGVWGFNEQYYLGLHLFGLPVEEWLFFLTVPFASVFIYECVRYFFPRIRNTPPIRIITLGLGIALMIVSLMNTGKAYTFWNFIFCGAFLMYIGVVNPPWLGKYWVAYLFHLVPFLLVNGILTGTYIDEEVVWYNNQENLGIRVLTIPVEDFIYSMLLLIMNVTFFEHLKIQYKLKT